MKIFSLAPLIGGAFSISTSLNTISGTAPYDIEIKANTDTDSKSAFESLTQATNELSANHLTLLNGLTQGQVDACNSRVDSNGAYTGIGRPGLTASAIGTAIEDLQFEYAMGYMSETCYDRHIDGLKLCIDDHEADTATATGYKTELDTSKGDLVIYPGQLMFDFTTYSTGTNPAGNTQLTTTQWSDVDQKMYFNQMKMMYADSAAAWYPTSTIANTAGDFSTSTAMAAFDSTSAAPTSIAEMDEYFQLQLRLKAAGFADQKWDGIHDNRQAVADEWFAADAADNAALVLLIHNRHMMYTTYAGYVSSDKTAYDEKMSFSPLFVTIATDNASKWADGNAKTSYDSIKTSINANLVNFMGFFLNFESHATEYTGTNNCKDSKEDEVKYVETYGASGTKTLNQKVADLLMLYAFRYINSAQINKEFEGFNECIDSIDASVLDADGKTAYKSALSSAKSGITTYDTGMIEMNWSLLTDIRNNDDNNAYSNVVAQFLNTYTTSEEQNFYVADMMRMWSEANAYFPQVNNYPASAIGAFTATALDSVSALADYNLETDFGNANGKALKEYMTNYITGDNTLDWNGIFYGNRDTIADAYQLTGTDKSNYESAYQTLKSNLDSWVNYYNTSRTDYLVVTPDITTMALSPNFVNVHSANSAKFATGQDNAIAAYTSVTAAIVAGQTAVDYVSALGTADLLTFQTAHDLSYGLDIPHYYYNVADGFYLYAFRYIQEEDIDRVIAAYKAGINAVNPSNAAALNTALDNAKSAIAQYTNTEDNNRIGLNWSTYVNAVNTPSTMDVTLTSAQSQSVYYALRIFYSDRVGVTAGADHLTASESTAIATAFADATKLSAVSDLISGQTFSTSTQFYEYSATQFRSYACEVTNEWESQLYNQRSSIATALDLSTSQKSSYEDSAVATKTLMDTWRENLRNAESNYSSSGKMAFNGLVILALAMKYFN